MLVLRAGCSGRHRASDIQAALQSHYRQQLQQAEDFARNLGGDALVNTMRAFGAQKAG